MVEKRKTIHREKRSDPAMVKGRRSKSKYHESGQAVHMVDDDFVNPPTKGEKSDKNVLRAMKDSCKNKVDDNDGKSKKLKFQPFGEDKLRTRVAPKQFYDAMKGLTDSQKEALEEMGFGCLASINLRKIPPTIGHWLVSNYDHQTCRLNLGKVVIKVSRKKVAAVLGIPVGGVKIVEKNPRTVTPYLHRWKNQFKNIDKIYVSHVLNRLQGSKKANTLFKLNFLVLFNTVLGKATKSSTVNQRFMHMISTTNEISNFDWAGYMIENLNFTRQTWVEGELFDGPIIFLCALFVMEMKKKFTSSRVQKPHLPFVMEKTLFEISNAMKRAGRFSLTELKRCLKNENKKRKRKNVVETNAETTAVEDDDDGITLANFQNNRKQAKKLKTAEEDDEVGDDEGGDHGDEGDDDDRDGDEGDEVDEDGDDEVDEGDEDKDAENDDVAVDEHVEQVENDEQDDDQNDVHVGDDQNDDNVGVEQDEGRVDKQNDGNDDVDDNDDKFDEGDEGVDEHPHDYLELHRPPGTYTQRVIDDCISHLSVIRCGYYVPPPSQGFSQESTQFTQIEKLVALSSIDTMLDQLANVVNALESSFQMCHQKYPGDEEIARRKKVFLKTMTEYKFPEEGTSEQVDEPMVEPVDLQDNTGCQFTLETRKQPAI